MADDSLGLPNTDEVLDDLLDDLPDSDEVLDDLLDDLPESDLEDLLENNDG